MKIRVLYLCLIGFLILSFNTNAQYTLEARLSSDADRVMRGCSDRIIFTLTPAASEDLSLEVTISGTAERDQDYTLSLGNNLLFLAGEEEASASLIAMPGGTTGLNESIAINVKGEELNTDLNYSINLVHEAHISINNVGDTILACKEIPIDVSASGDAGSFKWYPTDLVSDSIGKSTSLLPSSDGWFYVEGKIGSCDVYDSVYVELVDPSVSLFTSDPTEHCNFAEVKLNANTNFPDRFSWNHEDILSNPNSLTPTATVDTSTLFIGTLTFYNCTISDSLFIRIDTIPDVGLKAVPPTGPDCDKYCKGDVIKITDGQLYVEEEFPNMDFQWESDPTIINDLDTLRSILAQVDEDRTYYRTVTNGTCTQLDSIEIKVVDTFLEITPSDTTVCFGKPVQVVAWPQEGLTDIEWEPEEGLSCTDCLEPIIHATNTRTYTVRATKDGCCPVEASVNVRVNIPPIPIPTVHTCPGEPVRIVPDLSGLNLSNPQWVDGSDKDMSCTDCFDPIVTTSNPINLTLEAYDENGCLHRGSAHIAIYNEGSVSLDVDPGLTVSIGAEATVKLNTEDELDDEDISWYYNGSLLNETGTTASVRINNKGEENIITVEYIDNNGCKRKHSVVINGEEPDVQLPNAFSPDDSDNNNIFRPLFNKAPVSGDLIEEFVITNRFGKVVYNNELSQGWDGRINGNRKAPPDVYMYRIKIRLPNGVVFKTKGDVTLIR